MRLQVLSGIVNVFLLPRMPTIGLMQPADLAAGIGVSVIPRHAPTHERRQDRNQIISLPRCLGKSIAEVELTEALGAMLRLPNLRRGHGELTYAGPYPDTFVVDFTE